VALVGGGIAGQLLGARTTFVICGALSALVSLIVARARRSARSPVSQPAVKAETIDA
jgi:hypothetical protein